MKYLLLCAIFSLVSKAWSKNDSVSDMAARSIPYALRICELETDSERRKNMAKVLARSVFSYWYETRLLGSSKDEKIDSMVRLVYHSSLKNDLNETIKPLVGIQPLLKSVLKDPLDALGEDKNLKTKESWKFSTKKEYQELVKKFTDFLKS